jgi:flagellin-like hook-associated protein FlgL
MSSITALQSTLSTGISDVQKAIQTTQTQLATNKKDLDPGQLGQVTRLASQVTGYNSAVQNIAQARSAINVGQTGLSAINDLMTQLNDLANKSASGSLSGSDRTNLNVTFQALITQIDSIASNAVVNGVNLIGSPTRTAAAGVITTTNTNSLTVQTGLTSSDTATVAAAASDAISLGLKTATAVGTVISTTTIDITSATNAAAAVTALSAALTTISSNQSALAAADAGLAAKSKTDASISTNLQSAIDAIEKPDQASLQMQLTQLNNQQSIDYYLISQMNTASQAALTIFR